MSNYLNVLDQLTEGTFVKITGMEVKNENDIFVVDCDYRIENKYAVCTNQRCLYKVKINGEQKTSGYNIVFLDEKTISSNPNINIEIVTDLKVAKKEVNNWLKAVSGEEMVVSFEKSEDQSVKDGSIIRFPNGIKFGFWGDKYIGTRTIWQVKFRENGTIFIKELGKKGQEISTGNSYGCNAALTQKMIESCEVLNKIETKRSELNNKSEKENKPVEQTQELVTEHKEENITQEIVIEQDQKQESQKNNNVVVSLNEEKNGIEIKFSEKPSGEMLASLHAYGFRWSKYQKIWYAKQSEERINFASSLQNNKCDSEQNGNDNTPIEQVTQSTYPVIDINDIETYTVDQKLSDRENDAHWIFRTQKRNHQQELQKYLKQCNENATELINKTDNSKIQYDIKRFVQYYKKAYYKNYIARLTVNASNPSLATTGRAGRNMSKYNKALNRYDNLMRECVALENEYNSKIEKFKNKISKESQQKIEADVSKEIDNINKISISLEKIKKQYNPSAIIDIFNNPSNEINAYSYNNNYFIIKNWGYWRIYNKMGNEIKLFNRTTKNLEDAKNQLKYILLNDKEVLSV